MVSVYIVMISINRTRLTTDRKSRERFQLIIGTQTREHLFIFCPHWNRSQNVQRAEVRSEAGSGKDQQKILALFADARCSQMMWNIVATTEVGRPALKLAEEDASSEVLEWELRERNESEEYSMCT